MNDLDKILNSLDVVSKRLAALELQAKGAGLCSAVLGQQAKAETNTPPHAPQLEHHPQGLGTA